MKYEEIVEVQSFRVLPGHDQAVSGLLSQPGWELLAVRVIEDPSPKAVDPASVVYVLGRREREDE